MYPYIIFILNEKYIPFFIFKNCSPKDSTLGGGGGGEDQKANFIILKIVLFMLLLLFLYELFLCLITLKSSNIPF